MTTNRAMIVFDTVEGHTAEIAERIATRLRAADVSVETFRPAAAPPPGEADAVILGDSIHVGKHTKALTHYATENRAALAELPSALFQVSLTSAAHDDESVHKAHAMVEEFCAAAGWHPDLVGLFGGALAYTKYGWLKRRVLVHVAEEQGLSTDPTRDVDYTDWDAVDAFTDDFLALATR